jgi:hypothetical protein
MNLKKVCISYYTVSSTIIRNKQCVLKQWSIINNGRSEVRGCVRLDHERSQAVRFSNVRSAHDTGNIVAFSVGKFNSP